MKKINLIIKSISVIKIISKLFLPLTIIFTFLMKLSIFKKLSFASKVFLGKRPWIKILVLTRKTIVISIATIGILALWKYFGTFEGSFWMAVCGIGNQYIELFYKTWSTIHSFFSNILDKYIIPKEVPKSTIWPFNGNNSTTPGPWSGPGWFSKPVTNSEVSKIIENINLNINPPKEFKPWYTDIKTWMYIGSGFSIILAAYLGYSYYEEIFNKFKSLFGYTDETPRANKFKGKYREVLEYDTTHGNNNNSSGLLSYVSNAINYINPLKLFSTDTSTYDYFIKNQTDPISNHIDRRYYPHTIDNPFDNILTKFQKAIFGESELQRIDRNRVLDNYKKKIKNKY